jgi:hypothetical protein
MKRVHLLLCLVVFALALAGCSGGSVERSPGTVLLAVSSFDGLPSTVSVASGPYTITTVNLRNILKDPSGTSSDLQAIQLRAYEVTFTRRDTGTRVPPPIVQSIFGLVPAGGTLTLNNLQILTADQLLNLPLADLGTTGVDRETGSRVVVLNVSMRFFGRTLSGTEIASDPVAFTIEAIP